MEEFYIEFKSELRDLIEKQLKPAIQDFNPSELSSFNTACSNRGNVKLPKISIPVFSGRYTEWMTFRDLFISLVHNNSAIDDVQKLHYLKGSITGEAEQLLRHIPITNENYSQCWSMLENRYDNKQYLVNCILNGFFSKKKILMESASAIKDLLDSTLDMLNGIKSLGVDTDSWDILIIYIVSLKLDHESRKQWESLVSELSAQSNKLPNLKLFKEFLEKRFHSLEFLDPKITDFNKNKELYRNQTIPGPSKIVTMFGKEIVCIFCKGDHKLSSCKDFSSLEYNDKREFVQGNNVCFNCLTPRHSAKYCRSTICCKICSRRHHSLLHPKITTMVAQEANITVREPCEVANSPSNVSLPHSSDEGELHINSHFSKGTLPHVLLATALVDTFSNKHQVQTLRALIDQGSQASFVTEAVVQLLGLKKTSISGTITGLGNGRCIKSRAMVSLMIRSRIDPECNIEIKAYVLSKITSLLPSNHVELMSWPDLKVLELADPEYYIPNRIDILLGADVYGNIILEGLKKSPSGSTVAQNTELGWIISGIVQSKVSLSCEVTSMHAQLDNMLKSFWELESEPVNFKKIMTEEENKCEEIFEATTKRDETGRFIVKLPFRNTDPSCQYGDSRSIALKRFLVLEKKLQHYPYLKEEYEKIFKEYLELDHMRLVSENDIERKVYLPHHAVVREDKDTTKVRIVFDASCKDSKGRSLNNDLMVGPTLQLELRHLLMMAKTSYMPLRRYS
ncbi:uncharacterized protein LOC132902581 [Amyelois transitella]|uniref:uncharacterized protein LOC132902581 n=1 Tax=Amyelois transitella TaxID=680683 RepID=UPI00299018FC|nr:uncharacterized protein LOC132902581 [Amyelois transitella]